MKLLLLLTIFFISICSVNAENINDILDEKIEKFCFDNKIAKKTEQDFKQNNWTRCTNILQGIYRFETWNLKSYTWNNIFNFRSPTCKKDWIEKYNCEIKNWFLTFPNKTTSILFAIDRYYKYDYRKTVEQIIAGGCYYNLKWVYVCFDWFTLTKEHHRNYIDFILNFIKKSGNI